MEGDLTRLPVVILDCQTTGASPARGFLLEMAWAVLPTGAGKIQPDIHSFLVRLPDGEILPGRISRMTGLTEILPGDGLETSELAKLMLPVFRSAIPVAHFAVFEQRWIDHLFSEYFENEEIPRLICTREIARRLYPRLPRKGIRAVAGYLGFSMGEKKRAFKHVDATVFIWNNLVSELAERGIETLFQLQEYLAEPISPQTASLDYPLPRATRLSLPDCPGVYRLLSGGGEVLYTGKAGSLRRRVNSYFTRRKADEKTLELVSQVHDVSVEETESTLEAALLEFETIRRFDPPYNIAMRERDYRTVFLSHSLSAVSSSPGKDYPRGPVTEGSPALLFHSIMKAIAEESTIPAERLGLNYRPLEEGALENGFSVFRDELFSDSAPSADKFLSAGLASWLRHEEEKKKDDVKDVDNKLESHPFIDAAGVRKHLEWLLAAGARDLRRGAWFCLLGWSSILWKPATSTENRFAEFRKGRIASSVWTKERITSFPEHAARIERLQQFDAGLYDRLRVLDAEVRRITADGSLISVYTPGGYCLDSGKMSRIYRFL